MLTLLLRSDYLCAVLAAAIALLVLLLTAAPDVTGEDSGELVTAAYTLGIAHPPGYPIWCLLGKLFTVLVPFGSIAFRLNFMSAFFAAGAVFFLFLVVRKLTSNRIIAASSSLVFAFTTLFWSQSVIAEVYTLNTFFIAACLFLLLLWDEKRSNRLLYLLAFVAGLGCTNHHTMFPFALILAAYVIAKGKWTVLRPKVALTAVLLFVVALSVYLYLPLRARANPYINWGNLATTEKALDHVMRKQYSTPETLPGVVSEHERSWGKFGKQMLVYGDVYVRQFTWFLFWIPALGLWLLYREMKTEFFTFLALFILMSVGIVWFRNFKLEREYILADQIFFIPSFLIASIWMGIGFVWLWKILLVRVNWKAVRVAAPAVALMLPVINLFGNYYENDKSRYYYAYDLGKAILDTMDQNAIYFAAGDHTTFPVMYFQGVYSERPDVTIADKYGYIEKELYQGLIEQRKKTGKDAERISRQEIEKYIILKNRDKPLYFYVKRNMSDLPGHVQIPEGLLFRIIPSADFHSYKKKISKEYWRNYTFRHLEGEDNARDYTADLIISDYHYARARCYFEEGKVEHGIREIEKLQESAEGFKEIFNNLGSMLAERGLHKEAIKLYEKAISYDPNYLTAVRNMAKVHRESGDFDNSIKYLKRALEINPYDLSSHLELAQTYISMKDFDRAIAKLEDIIARSPGHYLAYSLLGYIYLNEKGDRRKAFELFQTSLGLNPEQPRIEGLLRGDVKKERPKFPKPPKLPEVPTAQPGIPHPRPPVVPRPRPPVPRPPIPRPPR